MHNSFGVGSVQRISNLDPQREQRFNFQRTPSNAAFQSDAIQKFHGNEGFPILLANVMNRANIRMVQRGCRLGFTLKTGESLRVAGNVFRKELEGDETVKPGVFRLIDHTHASTAQFLHNAVVRNGLPEHPRESYVRETGKSTKGRSVASLLLIATILPSFFHAPRLNGPAFCSIFFLWRFVFTTHYRVKSKNSSRLR